MIAATHSEATGDSTPRRDSQAAVLSILRLTFLAGFATFGLFSTSASAQPNMQQPGVGERRNLKEKPQENAALTINKTLRGTDANLQRLRSALEAQGINDERIKEAILAHAEAMEKLRQNITAKSQPLRANIPPNTALADAQFNVLLNEYLAAVEDYSIAREKSERELNEKVGYTKKPRLHALLLTMGVIGDAPQTGGVQGAEKITNRILLNRWDGNPLIIDRAGQPGAAAPNLNGNFVFGDQLGDAHNFPFPPAITLQPPFAGQFGGAQPFGGFQNFAAVPNANNAQVDELRRDLGVQIRELREEINRLKAAQEEKKLDKQLAKQAEKKDD